ncbi:unnamed protein product [[Candida] boidinii]|uniref:Unnamed protein product n=1 Tax=Candida boidinii TaxID=5477 RepID=A0A9W6T2U0_CANBO|nr:hypothetical protein BVG19_g948 [[Candida] boidinii]OWB50587.1 hypothetical protein B5S27_g2138 [[Candida] boidinii]OWB64961.1 hypothetical protein B5S30_g282 [[Candida] boidinii]OWB83074.1 hypothetical protein B5S33_g1703 [[Candida] boidinii]GME74428.1 unnamed protein product [[Candida] boidinii]
MMKAVLTLVVFFTSIVSGLHFYVDTDEARCFYEELPKDAMAVGKYEVFELNPDTNEYVESNNLKLEITVDETFDNNHRVVNQKNQPVGQFTFTSLDSGEHKFCLTPRHTDWSKRAKHRIFFDLAIGDAKPLVDSKRQGDVSTLTSRANNLINKLESIKREQSLFRKREAIFRNASESVNNRVVRWTIIQLVVLAGTCVWQLSYLKNFFVKQKVV